MTMFWGAGAAVLFFALIPAAGAVITQWHWRRFVQRMTAASEEPLWGGGSEGETGSAAPANGCVRFIGELESLQGGGVIWLRRGSLAVSVDAEGSDLYIMTDLSDSLDSPFPESMPEKTRWKRVSSAVQGTRFFVRGIPERRGGQWFLGAPEKERPLVILFEGDEDNLIPEAVWQGRPFNEVWNVLPPWSFLTGFMILLVLSFSTQLEGPAGGAAGEAVALLVLALFPLIPLIPPGVLLFLLARRLWREARSMRAERDLASLASYQGGLPFPGTLLCRARGFEIGASAALMGAFGVNFALLAVLLP